MPSLEAGAELVFPQRKRVVTQYVTAASGVTELHLYCGENDIAFDESELFAFGETLAKQSRFVARTSAVWLIACGVWSLNVNVPEVGVYIGKGSVDIAVPSMVM